MNRKDLSVYADNELDKSADNNAWVKLFNLIPNGSRVLDIGCSTGNFGRQLIKEKDCEVIGVDIFAQDLKVAEKNLTQAFLLNVEKDSLEHLGKFDVVLMADVIEHLIDPVDALNKAKKALKPNGILVFSVPNMANIAVRIELLKGRFEYTSYGLLDQTHLHYYDRIQIEQVLHNAGFSVKKYDNTIRDVPENLLKDELSSIGLTVKDKFLRHARHTDAVTFQFIGVAKVSKTPHAPISSKTPFDFVDKKREEDEKELRTVIANQEKIIKEESIKRSNAEFKLENILQSKGWRFLQKIYEAKRPFVMAWRKLTRTK